VIFLIFHLLLLFLGMVLGSFYYGYIVLQIPGGWLATKIGGTRIFGTALLLASILTLLTPAAARFSVYALIVLRVLEGVVLVSCLFCFFTLKS